MILSDMQVASVIATVLVGLILPQVGLTVWFAAMVRGRMRAFRGSVACRDHAAAVPAEVVLCLRGCDATLEDVLASLARQGHREWRLRVIVDSEDDPAWAVAQRSIAYLERRGASWHAATIEPLAARPTTGSLKCASLRQAFASLDDRTEVVALIDADSVVRQDWLVTLVAETLRRGVGAVSGNRWYEPIHDSIVGTVRVLWNVGAIVQMSAFGIPWGGSLAVRREALEACGWPDVIRTTLCEDTALAAPLAQSGWQYRFVPALIAVDEDDAVSLVPLTRWITRQLLTARLHHPAWLLVAVHGLGTSLALLAAVACATIATVRGSPDAALVAIGAVALYELASAMLVLAIASTARAAVAASGGDVRPFSIGRASWQAILIPLTQAVYAKASLDALRTRSIEWRGIIYEITRFEGRYGVRVRPAGGGTDYETARAAKVPT